MHGPTQRILLVYTGGTIGMKESPQGLIPVSVDDLLEQLPDLGSLPLELSLCSLNQPMDSSDLQPRHWQEMGSLIAGKADEFDGFLVLHGTDTMAYSSAALSFMLQQLNKPVIFTGSQLPLSHPRSDAGSHLMSALELASACNSDGSPKIPEVTLYFNHQLYRGNRVRKIHALGFDAFDSPNFPVLARAGTRMVISEEVIGQGMPVPDRTESVTKGLRWRPELDTAVGSIKCIPGMSGKALDKYLKDMDFKVLLLEAYGTGNIPNDTTLLDALRSMVARGGQVVALSQCLGGRVDLNQYQAGRRLLDLGALEGKDISFEAALTKSMHLLGCGVPDFAEAFGRSLAGEIS